MLRSKKQQYIRIIIVLLALWFAGEQLGYSQTYKDDPDLITTPSGLKYKITRQGSGDFPTDGDRLWVHYYAKFENDSIYDSSADTGPIDFYLGQGQVTKGWDEGLRKIKPGGAILLVVPPELAYGKDGHGKVPPYATLIFEIALLQVDKGEPIKPFNVEGLKLHKGKKNLKYYIVKEGTGEYTQMGDNAYVHYTCYLPDGTIFDSSRKKGDPVRITAGINQVIPGWDMGLFFMKKGSKIRLIIPYKLAYGDEGLNNVVPPKTDITMDIEMVDLVPPPPVKRWDISNKEVHETPSGLKYVILEPGTGDLIKDEDIVVVNYSGYYTNGELFDSSVKRFEPIKIPVGIGAVIEGWDEGLKLMRKGSKFQLIVPSKLAYGEKGVPGQIDPNTDLIFDIEVIDVLK